LGDSLSTKSCRCLSGCRVDGCPRDNREESRMASCPELSEEGPVVLIQFYVRYSVKNPLCKVIMGTSF